MSSATAVKALAAIASVCAAAAAQSTFVVGPSGLPDVQAAVDAAAPGDEIVIEPGSYQPFVCEKPLTIRAQTPGTVTFPPWPAVPIEIRMLAPGETAELVGLDAGRLVVLLANVSVEDCTFSSAWRSVFVLGTAHFERCTITEQPATLNSYPLYATAATVSMVACTVTGAPASSSPTGGNQGAVFLDSSRLVASDCVFETGIGPAPSTVVFGDPTASAWISDSALVGSPNACPVFGNFPFTMARTTVTPACASLQTGPLVGIASSGPWTRGQTWQVDLRSEPLQPLLLVAAPRLASSLLPVLAQPLLLPASEAFPLAGLVANANGQASWSFALPQTSLPPGATAYVQAIGGTSLPLGASPVVGGVVR